MNVIDVIANYLRDNRRLVVPAFGAFIVKDSGNILFSELLKTDDGVLRGLLSAGGLSELESAVLIDRFIFDARNALSEDGYFDMGVWGRLAIGVNGEIKFVPAKAEQETNVVEKPAEPTKTASVTQSDITQSEKQPERRKTVRAADNDYYAEPKKRGVDWFVVAAVVVLLAAVAVIIYGYFCSAEQDDEMMMDSLRWQTEQTLPDNK